MIAYLSTVLVTCALAGLPSADVTTTAPTASKRASLVPPAPAVPLDNGALSFPSLQGKVVLVQFTATYCPACNYVVPRLNEFVRDYRARGLEVIGLAPHGERTLQRHRRNKGIHFRLWTDHGGRMRDQADVNGTPTFFLLDRDGEVRVRWMGASWAGLDDLEAQVQALLDEPAKRG